MFSKNNMIAATILIVAVVQINASGHYLQHPLVGAPHAYASAPVFAPALTPAFAVPVPAFAHAQPALTPVVPAPAVVGLKHSIPYAVPPFVGQINIFRKYLTPVVPAPIIATPHLAHAPILGASIFTPHLESHALPLAFGK